MRIPIVNEQDQVIGFKIRNDRETKDIYRVASLWLMNTDGEVLITQRSATKVHNPNCWGPAAAGTVEEGETYQENIIKETEEEIGLTGIGLTQGPKVLVRGHWTFFNQWFSATVDKNTTILKLQKEEVEDFAWIRPEQLRQDLRSNPDRFVPSFQYLPESYLQGEL